MKKPNLILLMSLLIIGCSTAVIKSITFQTPDLTQISDGVYRGNNDISGTPNVSLNVSVQNNRINNIEIINHGCSPIGSKAERIVYQIIDDQSLDIDTVSGATLSSKAILRAVENALKTN